MSAQFQKNFDKYLKKNYLKKEASEKATAAIKSRKSEQNHHMYMLFVNFNMPMLSCTQTITQKHHINTSFQKYQIYVSFQN